MTIASINTAIVAKPRQTALVLRILNWLATRDAAYRQNVKLQGLPQERLDDMGMTRADANQVFYQRFGNRAADKAPVDFRTRW